MQVDQIVIAAHRQSPRLADDVSVWSLLLTIHTKTYRQHALCVFSNLTYEVVAAQAIAHGHRALYDPANPFAIARFGSEQGPMCRA